MAETPVPITTGSGTASVAADLVAGASYQQIKIVDGTIGNNNALIVNSDGTANVRISGSVATAGNSFTGSVSGTVGASIIGIAPVFIVGGSIAGTFTTPNQSVSGTVGASIIGTVPVTQSGTQVTSLVSTVPSSVLVGASIFGQLPGGTAVLGSIATLQGTNPWIITGSVQGSFAPSGNQSVSGTVGASIIGIIPVQIPSSVAVAIISGSIAASFTPPANQSVSGTVQTNVIGSVATVIIGGSIAASFTPPANQSVSGTVQTNVIGSVATVIIGGSIAASFTPPANQSVSGTVGASIIGTVPVTQSGVWTHSVIGTYPDSFVASTVTGIPFMFKANISSSIMQAVSPTFPLPVTSAPQSVSGTVGASIIGQLPAGTAVLGSVATLQGTNPWIVVSSLAGGIFPVSGSVSAVIIGNASVSGTVGASIIGLTPVSVIGTVSTFWTGGGNSNAGADNNNQLSVPITQTGGSTGPVGNANYVYNGTNWDRARGNSSIGTLVNTGTGSVLTILQSPSIVGTYLEDNPAASGDRGLLSLNVRNDTLSSVTSTDGDYGAMSIGPSGEVITANSPLTKWISGTADFRGISTASITVIAAQGASVFTYITGVQVANYGPSSVLVTLTGATSSTLAYTIAPSGGGSNIVYINGLKTNANGAFAASVNGVSSVLISAQGFISKS